MYSAYCRKDMKSPVVCYGADTSTIQKVTSLKFKVNGHRVENHRKEAEKKTEARAWHLTKISWTFNPELTSSSSCSTFNSCIWKLSPSLTALELSGCIVLHFCIVHLQSPVHFVACSLCTGHHVTCLVLSMHAPAMACASPLLPRLAYLYGCSCFSRAYNWIPMSALSSRCLGRVFSTWLCCTPCRRTGQMYCAAPFHRAYMAAILQPPSTTGTKTSVTLFRCHCESPWLSPRDDPSWDEICS